MDYQYMNIEYPFLSSKLNFRSGKRKSELVSDAVPNKFLKLTVVALDEEDNSNTVDQNNSSIVTPDHDYCQCEGSAYWRFKGVEKKIQKKISKPCK